MNDWTRYRAECGECVYYSSGTCDRLSKERDAICLSFRLTAEAEARRYVSAKEYGARIGIHYDEQGFILRGKPKAVREWVQRILKGNEENE